MARRRYSLVFSGLLLSTVAVLACTKDIEKPNDLAQVNTGKVPNPGGSTEGGFPDSAKPDAGADGGEAGACNDLEPVGNAIDKIAVASDAPPALGGTLVDGIYDLKDYSYYVGISGTVQPLGITARRTIRVDGTAKTIDDVYEITVTGNPAVTTLASSAYSLAGSAFATSGICPAGGGKTWQYTANALNQIVLTDTGTREGFTFLKRP